MEILKCLMKCLSQAGEHYSTWAPTFSSSERLWALLLRCHCETFEIGVERNLILQGTGTDSPAKILFFLNLRQTVDPLRAFGLK